VKKTNLSRVTWHKTSVWRTDRTCLW